MSPSVQSLTLIFMYNVTFSIKKHPFLHQHMVVFHHSVIWSTFVFLVHFPPEAHCGRPYQQRLLHDMQINLAAIVLKDEVKHVSPLLCLLIIKTAHCIVFSVSALTFSTSRFSFQKISPVRLNPRAVFCSNALDVGLKIPVSPSLLTVLFSYFMLSSLFFWGRKLHFLFVFCSTCLPNTMLNL